MNKNGKECVRFIRVFQNTTTQHDTTVLTSACGIEKRRESSSGVCGGGDVKLALSLEVRRGYCPFKNNIDHVKK